MSEIADFVLHRASTVTPRVVEKVLRELPLLRGEEADRGAAEGFAERLVREDVERYPPVAVGVLQDCAAALGLSGVRLLNDFTAQALALPHLGTDERAIQRSGTAAETATTSGSRSDS